MHHRVIHVSSPAFLELHLGAFQIRAEERDPVLIPLEDIGVVILDGPQATITSQIAAAFANQNIALVVTAENHLPCAILQPIAAHTLHPQILRQQIQCSVPKVKRIWQQIVIAKIQAQASLLRQAKSPSPKIEKLAETVLSGDSYNNEAQAAALYWPRLLGKDFYRDFSYPGANSMLNYGYAVLRALVARAISGAGLHPSLGVHHHHRENAFALADDAMEPLRPLVDAFVKLYLKNNHEPEKLTPDIKRYLVQITVLPVIYAGKDVLILEALENYAASLRRGICEEARKIEIPRPSWSAVIDKCGSW